MLATHPGHFSFFNENPSIRATETRFYEPERLSTPAKPLFSLKPLDATTWFRVVVILAACYIFPFLAGGHVTENQSKVYARDSKALLGILFFVLRRKLVLL